ncbi:hypothetical protein ACL02T_17545 [Pseudonocardia sp. RS010]|uniref:hypothetical protein n=1 Tax=Pseudonocardia sp. RS010 TaxID=3385979 RepID=UPI00399FE225
MLHDPNPIDFDLDAVAAADLGDPEVNQGGVDCDAWADRGDGVRALDGTAAVVFPR